MISSLFGPVPINFTGTPVTSSTLAMKSSTACGKSSYLQYIDWGAYKCRKYEDLPQAVLDFIAKVEEVTGVPVKLIGTGPNNDDIIDIR